MILKIAGMVFVFGTSVLAGLYYGNLDGFRIGDLMEMKKALSILHSEIEFAHTPLSEALANIGQRTSKPIAGMFLMLEELLHVERGATISVLWERCVRAFAGQTYFNKEDIEQMVSFGKTLGYLDKGMQLTNISITTDYINEKTAQLNENRFKNKRMFQSLGFLGGLLVIVIFM